jgi:hypothetical protein
MPKKEAAIPLKSMMEAIDTNDFDFYSRLTDEQKKAFSPWLAMRYASSATGNMTPHYLLMVNDIVNCDFSTLKDHPNLQWKLLAVCGSGRPTFHPWIPPGKGKKKKSKLYDFVRKTYPSMENKDIDIWLSLNSEEDVIQLARDAGMDEKEIKELLK